MPKPPARHRADRIGAAHAAGVLHVRGSACPRRDAAVFRLPLPELQAAAVAGAGGRVGQASQLRRGLLHLKGVLDQQSIQVVVLRGQLLLHVGHVGLKVTDLVAEIVVGLRQAIDVERHRPLRGIGQLRHLGVSDLSPALRRG